MTVTGTPLYMAPEILQDLFSGRGQARFGSTADIFSIGVVTLFCLTTELVTLDRMTPNKLKEQVEDILNSIQPILSSTQKRHLQKMLEFDPKDRMTDDVFSSFFGGLRLCQ